MFRKLAAATAVALGMLASAAHAVTVDYKTYVSGADLGDTVIATLEVTQNGSNVDFALSNVLESYASSFVMNLGLNYAGGSVQPLTFGNLAGKTATFAKDDTPPPGNPYNILVSFPTSNAQQGAARLKPGTYASWTIFGTELGDFDFALGKTQLHMNATLGGQSTKYTGTTPPVDAPAPVPLPATALLLVAGLGSLSALRRRA